MLGHHGQRRSQPLSLLRLLACHFPAVLPPQQILGVQQEALTWDFSSPSGKVTRATAVGLPSLR